MTAMKKFHRFFAVSLLFYATTAPASRVYPLVEIHRPLVLPGGVTEIHASFERTHIETGGNDSTTLQTVFMSDFGVNEPFQTGVATAFLYSPDFAWGKYLQPQGAWLIHDGWSFDLSAAAAIPLYFEGDLIQTFTLAAPMRYNVLSRLALYAGDRALPVSFAPGAMSIDINVGVGVQLTWNTVIRADTRLWHIKLAGQNNSSNNLADIFPLAVLLQYSVDAYLDFVGFANFADFTGGASENYTLGINVVRRL